MQVIRPTLSKWRESNHVKSVAAGEFHSLYLTNSGHLYSCGNNDVGQLGRHTDHKEGKAPGNNIILFISYMLNCPTRGPPADQNSFLSFP